ncbi:hypothetical protein SDC9_118189 [bioreactor metagenome]|uniref:Uncharacterized protein n=1 Tax=bioreactor metagenome TaxID=1076179 RepID=A0A645C078_9ZZZZ
MKIFKVILAIMGFIGAVAGGYYLVKKYLDGKGCCSCESCDDFCCFDEEETDQPSNATEESSGENAEEHPEENQSQE